MRCARWSRRPPGARRRRRCALSASRRRIGCAKASPGSSRSRPDASSCTARMIAAACRSNRIGIEIEAALAFGTGHHGTTRGCLLALDPFCKSLSQATASSLTDPRFRHRQRRPRHRGGARAASARARDRYRRGAVRVARDNARLNRVAPLIETVKADGIAVRSVCARTRRSISSSPISCSARCSGWRRRSQSSPRPAPASSFPVLLPAQANAALAAYRGFALERRIDARWLDHAGARAPHAAAPRRCPPPTRPHRLPRMFEAHFQSFEDRGDRAASAPRVAALRAELERRGLDGFIVPRADRFQNEYVPPCGRAARLAHRLHRLGRRRDRARRPRRRSSSTAAIRCRCARKSTRGFLRRASGRTSAAGLDRSQPAGGREARLFAVAAYRRRRRTAGQGLRRGGREPRCRRRQSARRDLDRSAAAAARRGRAARSALCRRGRRASSRACATKSRKLAADALVVSDPHAVSWLFNIRGSDVPHTPVALAFALVPQEGRPALYLDGRKLGNDVRHRLEELAAVRATAEFERDLAALGSEQRAVRLDPAACPEAIARLVDRERRQDRARQRPDHADEGGEERRRDRRRARGATARRRGGDALPRLVRPRGAGADD